MIWAGGFDPPELTSFPDAAGAAACFAAFQLKANSDPGRYGRAVGFIFEGDVCWISDNPPAFTTTAGVVLIPTTSPEPVTDPKPGWRPWS